MATTLVRVELEDGSHTSVGASFAKSKGLKILTDEPATQHGRPIPADTAATMKGKALDEALATAGLATSGSLKERQQRLSDFQTSGASVAGGSTTTAGQTGS